MKYISYNYFYKVYINSVDHIIRNSNNSELVKYLNLLFETPIDGLGLDDGYFYLSYSLEYEWMGGDKHGHDWYIRNNYKYGGVFLSNKEIRRLKLEAINGK